MTRMIRHRLRHPRRQRMANTCNGQGRGWAHRNHYDYEGSMSGLSVEPGAHEPPNRIESS